MSTQGLQDPLLEKVHKAIRALDEILLSLREDEDERHDGRE